MVVGDASTVREVVDGRLGSDESTRLPLLGTHSEWPTGQRRRSSDVSAVKTNAIWALKWELEDDWQVLCCGPVVGRATSTVRQPTCVSEKDKHGIGDPGRGSWTKTGELRQ